MAPLNISDLAGWRCDAPVYNTSTNKKEPCARWQGHTNYEDFDHMTYMEVMACFVTVIGLYEGYTEDEIENMFHDVKSDVHVSLWTVRASMIYKSKVYVRGRDNVPD